MDRRLLHYYNRELQHLRETAGEFAKENPKIASRLALDEFTCIDPYVERLLEGFAYLAARVQLKLDAEFPRFTQAFLETVYPQYLAPTPSMAVVQFEVDPNEGGPEGGFPIPRGTALRSVLGRGEQTPCEFRTAHEVRLFPLRITEAQYYTRDLPSLELPPGIEAKAGLRIRLQAGPSGFKPLGLDRLTLHLTGADRTPTLIYENLIGRGTAAVVRSANRMAKWHQVLPRSAIRQVGFEDAEALLPYDARSFHGYRLLHEYFAFPQRFLFVEFSGLSPAAERCAEPEMDIVILMKEADLALENAVSAANFALFCAPAINLFPKRADRIHLEDRFSEFGVVPDRTRPLDFEVYQVTGVTGYGARPEEEQEFRPFYSASDFEAEGGGGAYFAVNRVPRLLTSREQRMGRRSSYAGSDLYVSLVDAHAAPYRSDLRQLGVSCLCTNRDLAIQMPVGRGRTDFTLDISTPAKAVRCLGHPTPPRPSYAEGDIAWRAISHLALNYLSLCDSGGPASAGGAPPGAVREGAAALRDLLKLYGDAADLYVRKQVDGVKSVSSRAIVRRVATPGPIAFARGLEVAVTFDEAAFEGTGSFLLGAVLERFFAKYVSINSFTETVAKTLDRGEVMRWPARAGQRQIL